jgi:hypothetical protein
MELQKRSNTRKQGKSVAPKTHLLPVTAVEDSKKSSKIGFDTPKGMAQVETSPAFSMPARFVTDQRIALIS